MVLRLLSNVCVATLFYQLPEYHVYPFLRNLLYLIYIQNWLSVLRDDKRFIVSAAGKAEKAVNLILGTAA